MSAELLTGSPQRGKLTWFAIQEAKERVRVANEQEVLAEKRVSVCKSRLSVARNLLRIARQKCHDADDELEKLLVGEQQ